MRALLVCNGGFSTSQIATKLTEIGHENNDYFEATSIISPEWMDMVNDFDMIMVSPQTSFRFDNVREFLDEEGHGQALYQMKTENYRLDKSQIIYDLVKDAYAKHNHAK